GQVLRELSVLTRLRPLGGDLHLVDARAVVVGMHGQNRTMGSRSEPSELDLRRGLIKDDVVAQINWRLVVTRPNAYIDVSHVAGRRASRVESPLVEPVIPNAKRTSVVQLRLVIGDPQALRPAWWLECECHVRVVRVESAIVDRKARQPGRV